MQYSNHTSAFSQTASAFSACSLIALLWLQIPHPAIAALALLPIMLICGLIAPFLVCLAFIAFSFFRLHEVFPQLYPLRIPQLLALGTLASLSINMLVGRMQPFWCRELGVFTLFFVLVCIGSLLASNRAEAIASLSGTYIKIAIIVFAISWLLTKPSQFRLLLLTMVVVGILVGLVTLYNKANGLELVEGTRVTIGRSIGSMLGDPNDLSLVLLFPASFALAMLLTPQFNIGWKLLGLSGYILVVCAIIATQSRGGLLGICAVSGIFAWHRVQNKVLLISVGLLALSVLFVLAGVSDRASGGAHEEGIDESAMGRIYAWQAAFGMALHNPLFGVGLNNFIFNYFDYSPHWDGKNHAVHSTWFGVMAETGLVGLIVFLALIYMIARLSISAYQRTNPKTPDYQPVLFAAAQSLQAGLAGFCVSGTFLTMGFTWPLYILLALAIALSNCTQNRSQNDSQSNSEQHAKNVTN